MAMNVLHWIATLPWWAPAAGTECVFVGLIVLLYPFSMFNWAKYTGDAIAWVSWASFFVFYGVWFGRHSDLVTIPAVILVPIVGLGAFVLLVQRSMKQGPSHMSVSTAQFRSGKILQFPGTRKGRIGR